MGNYPLTLPRSRNIHSAAIRADVIVLYRNVRRIVFEMSTQSEANVHIHGVAIAVQFPQSRHRHFLPRRIVEVGAEEVGRTLVGVGHPIEFPLPVERHALRVVAHERGMHGVAVHLVHLLVVPFRKTLSLSPHRRSSESREQKESYNRVVYHPGFCLRVSFLRICNKGSACR